jgi:PAS domain S-box-containing protein
MTDKNRTVHNGHKLPLSVLLVEDNSDDAALCLRVLKKAHSEIRCDVVKTREEFVNHLRDGTYDIVLADYALGPWTGMEALNILRKSGLDIPFILVTGALGEEKAVACITSGVADYVLKDRMERLPVAIFRAVEEKVLRDEHRRDERSLRESEEKFRRLAETIPAATFIEQGTHCCYVNHAAEDITGYSRRELLAMNFWDLLLPDSRQAMIERPTKPFDGDDAATRQELEIVTKQGETLRLDVTVSIFQNDGRLAALITAFEATASVSHRTGTQGKAHQAISEMSLDELREGREMTQQRLADTLGVTQTAMFEMEQRTDMHLSTLNKIVNAMGGSLDIRATFPDTQVRINQFGHARPNGQPARTV